jgi:hypothetical protein
MRSPDYLLWINRCDQLFVIQKQALRNKMLCGKYECLLELVRPDKRRRDGSNFFKAPEDYLVRIGLIRDDSDCERGTFAWVKGDGAPPYGCRLTVWDVE